MCYKCSICSAVSEPGKPRRTWPLKRLDGSILSEPTVCGDCLSMLQTGVPYPVVQRQRGRLPEPVLELPPPPVVEVEAVTPTALPVRALKRVAVKPPAAKLLDRMRRKQPPV